MYIIIRSCFLIIIFVCHSYSQYSFDISKINPSIRADIETLSQKNVLEGVFVGNPGIVSKTYALYRKIRLASSSSDLAELTNHPKAIIRCYAFWGLAERKEKNLITILVNHIIDTERINTLFADVGSNVMVGDFMIQTVVPKFVFFSDYAFSNNSQLDEHDISVLDSVVIFSPNNLSYRKIALLNCSPIYSYYPRIRNLAEQNNIYSIIPLSKYKKEKDINLILSSINFEKKKDEFYSCFYYTMMAISNFPNEETWEFTKNLSFEDFQKDSKIDGRNFETYFEAVASFRRPESITLLNKPEFAYYSLMAMQKYNDTLYDSLKFSIWENSGIYTKESVIYLLSRDSGRVLKDIVNTLRLQNRFLQYSEDPFLIVEYGKCKESINEMFNILSILNPTEAISILKQKLISSTYNELQFYSSKAKTFRNEEIVTTMLSRLENDGDLFMNDDYWSIMKGIISFGDSVINEKMIASILKNDYAVSKKHLDETQINKIIGYIKGDIIDPRSSDEKQEEKYR